MLQTVPNGIPNSSNIVLTPVQIVTTLSTVVITIVSLTGGVFWLDNRSAERDAKSTSDTRSVVRETEQRIENHLREVSVRNEAEHAEIKKEIEALPPKWLVDRVGKAEQGIDENREAIRDNQIWIREHAMGQN